MKLQKQDIGVWVKAENELPENGQRVLTRNTNNSLTEFTYYSEGKESWQKLIIEWLKPIQRVYVLTENQMLELLNKIDQKFVTDDIKDLIQ